MLYSNDMIRLEKNKLKDILTLFLRTERQLHSISAQISIPPPLCFYCSFLFRKEPNKIVRANMLMHFPHVHEDFTEKSP